MAGGPADATERGSLEFWFDLASPYAYLAASRIERRAAEHGVPAAWRPFVLGAIFRAQGWETSPFVVYPAKGRYMWRDVERRAAAWGVPFKSPVSFPQNSVQAHRLALVGLEEGWGQNFAGNVFRAEFVDGEDIAAPATLERCVADAGGDPRAARDRAASEPIKSALRDLTQRAMSDGIFGSPTFVVDRELFWGDDRLDDALLWADRRHPLQARAAERPDDVG